MATEHVHLTVTILNSKQADEFAHAIDALDDAAEGQEH